MRRSHLDIQVAEHGTEVEVRLRGALRLGEELRLRRALPVGPIDATVDGHEIRAVGAAGFDVLVAWAAEVAAAGGSVRLGRSSPALESMAQAMGLGRAVDLLAPYASRGPAAVTA